MMIEAKSYFLKTKEIVDEARESQRTSIIKMAKAIGDCMLDNGIIQLLGVKADRAFAMELGYRAGGLMPFHQLNMKDLVLRGILSVDEMNDPDFYDRADLANRLWNLYRIDPQDVVLIYAVETVYLSVLEIAQLAKAQGHQVFLVANMQGILKGKHADHAKELIAMADLTLDLCTPTPDTLLELTNGIKITQVGNVVGNIFAQMLTAQIYRYLVDLGEEPAVLLSANVTGADVHNRLISDRYLGRWNS
jgi:uncharacterized phosphosugar-binding protein